MSPCGCKKDKNMTEGNFKMRFVGRPGGRLMKGAPGNFKQMEIVSLPFRYSKFPFWQLVEPPPELKIPSASKDDSVFEDAVFVPDDDAAVEMHTLPTEVGGANVNPSDPAIIEPYMKLNLRTGKMREAPSEADFGDMEGHPTPNFNTQVEVLDESPPKTREELQAILDAKGIEYPPKTRTTTLAKMVEELPA